MTFGEIGSNLLKRDADLRSSILLQLIVCPTRV
jgi:hypothetical protein